MNITREIISKYNKLFFEILTYYDLSNSYCKYLKIDKIDIYICCLNIHKLGYRGNKSIDAELAYLVKNNCKLLVPFHKFSACFSQDKLRLKLRESTLYDMNHSIETIRRHKKKYV